MELHENWIYTEKTIQPVAETMGHLLARIRSQFATSLLDTKNLHKIFDRASESPVTMAAFPFGLEIPLHDPRPRADFGVSLVGNSLTADIYQARSKVDAANQSIQALGWLLNQTDAEDSNLRRIVGQKMMLEYDIDEEKSKVATNPGIFLYPIDDVLAGNSDRFDAVKKVYDALTYAGGWDASEPELAHLKTLYERLPSTRCIKAVGTFPARRRLTRIAATGFTHSNEVAEFLQKLGWSGDTVKISEWIKLFEAKRAFTYLGLHFDITPDGIGATLGLSFFAKQSEWLKDIQSWVPLIEGIDACQFAQSHKLTELVRWATGSTTLMLGNSNLLLVRGIHHIKLTVTDGEVDGAKAYVFFLMMTVPR